MEHFKFLEIAEVRTARTDVEKRRKELKQDALDIAACPDLLAVAEEVINNQEALPAYLVAMAIHVVGRATI